MLSDGFQRALHQPTCEATLLLKRTSTYFCRSPPAHSSVTICTLLESCTPRGSSSICSAHDATQFAALHQVPMSRPRTSKHSSSRTTPRHPASRMMCVHAKSCCYSWREGALLCRYTELSYSPCNQPALYHRCCSLTLQSRQHVCFSRNLFKCLLSRKLAPNLQHDHTHEWVQAPNVPGATPQSAPFATTQYSPWEAF